MQMITQEILKELFFYEPDTGALRNRYSRAGNVIAGAIAGYSTHQGYRRVKVKGRKYLAHRIVWMYVHGKWPQGILDHINGDKADNRICNLRECDASENISNSKIRRDNKTGCKGVYWVEQRKKWMVEITKNKTKYRSFFDSFELAAYEAGKVRARLHGAFAKAE